VLAVIQIVYFIARSRISKEFRSLCHRRGSVGDIDWQHPSNASCPTYVAELFQQPVGKCIDGNVCATESFWIIEKSGPDISVWSRVHVFQQAARLELM